MALKDQDRDVRSIAAEALGKIGDDKAIDALIMALKDEDRAVRSSAAEALGQIGSAVCLEQLLHLADRTVIESQEVFPLARRWAVRFSKAGLPFIPVYPELIQTSETTE
jgi:HEAT repeat protein